MTSAVCLGTWQFPAISLYLWLVGSKFSESWLDTKLAKHIPVPDFLGSADSRSHFFPFLVLHCLYRPVHSWWSWLGRVRSLTRETEYIRNFPTWRGFPEKMQVFLSDKFIGIYKQRNWGDIMLFRHQICLSSAKRCTISPDEDKIKSKEKKMKCKYVAAEQKIVFTVQSLS